MTCFSWLVLLTLGIVTILSLIRWFEQATDAVREGQWGRVTLLILCPFAVWRFPSRFAAGRPTPVPHHQPVRGFGTVPKAKPDQAVDAAAAVTPSVAPSDTPPPGTPPEFLVKPTVPPKKPGKRPAVDPEKLAKLRQKMREQGMLPPDEQA